MKNVTISVEEELYRMTRIEAAKAGISMSKFMALATQEKIAAEQTSKETQERNIQLEAIEAFLSGPKWQVMESGRMPTADERNARG